MTKGPENLILGIFSNRQKLMQALTFSGLEGCYIRGTRKNKEVNDGTIGDEVVYHKRRCDIYCEDEIAYRIGLYGVNHMNPKFIEEAKQRIKSAKFENEIVNENDEDVTYGKFKFNISLILFAKYVELEI